MKRLRHRIQMLKKKKKKKKKPTGPKHRHLHQAPPPEWSAHVPQTAVPYGGSGISRPAPMSSSVSGASSSPQRKMRSLPYSPIPSPTGALLQPEIIFSVYDLLVLPLKIFPFHTHQMGCRPTQDSFNKANQIVKMYSPEFCFFLTQTTQGKCCTGEERGKATRKTR